MLEAFTAYLIAHRFIAIFFGAFFFGDGVLLTAAYLAGQYDWAPAPLFFAAFMGTFIADSLWFFAGTYMARTFADSKFMVREREKASSVIQALVGEKPVYALVFIKFLYGSRLALILYVASRGLSYGVFAIYNSIGIFVWLSVFFTIGILAGKQIGPALPALSTIQLMIGALIVFFILTRLLSLWLTKRITHQ